MSNEELIKKFYIDFQNQDNEECLKACDENITWETAEGMPNGGKYVGRRKVFEDYFPKMLKNFKEFYTIPEQIQNIKDHVMVTGRYKGISTGGKKFEVMFSHTYLVKNNKIIQFRQFTDTKVIQESVKS